MADSWPFESLTVEFTDTRAGLELVSDTEALWDCTSPVKVIVPVTTVEEPPMAEL